MAFYSSLSSYKEQPKHVINTFDPDYPNKASWIASRLLTLRHDLNEVIEKDRKPNSLIIGSWNIRAFDGGLPRLDESFHYIAEIIDHFDICAIQEVKVDLGPLKRLVKLLGPNWEYFVSDVSIHEGGNSERMAFVYNKNKVFFRNLIGEIVLPNDELIDGNQVARSPFFASFQAGWFKFTLCSAHIIYGDDKNKRAAEIKAIGDLLVKRAKKENQVHIFLGDMNIEKKDDKIMKALKDTKLIIPDFGPTNMKGDMWYDQMAIADKGSSGAKTKLLRHGSFDWRHSVYGPHPTNDPIALSAEDIAGGKSRLSKEEFVNHYGPVVSSHRVKYEKAPYDNFSSYYSTWMTHEISDHLPIWMELEIDYSDDYLRQFIS